MQQTILIIPGWQDSGPQHWQSLWLKKYPNAIKVVQKDFMNPEKEEWVKTLNDYIEKYKDTEIILVGHSLSCETIAYWSEKYAPTSSAKIKGALLVSPVDVERPNTPKEIAGFSPIPLIKLNFKSIVVASENDPWTDLARSEFFAKSWNSEFINIGPHGHINTDAGFGEWSEGEKLLQQLTQ